MPLPNAAQPHRSALAARKARRRLHANQVRLARFPVLFPWLPWRFRVQLGWQELAGRRGKGSLVLLQEVQRLFRHKVPDFCRESAKQPGIGLQNPQGRQHRSCQLPHHLIAPKELVQLDGWFLYKLSAHLRYPSAR